jgi:hypothetical protein
MQDVDPLAAKDAANGPRHRESSKDRAEQRDEGSPRGAKNPTTGQSSSGASPIFRCTRGRSQKWSDGPGSRGCPAQASRSMK